LDTIIKAEKCDKKINKQNEQQLHGCWCLELPNFGMLITASYTIIKLNN